jgi:hypothetical protein
MIICFVTASGDRSKWGGAFRGSLGGTARKTTLHEALFANTLPSVPLIDTGTITNPFFSQKALASLKHLASREDSFMSGHPPCSTMKVSLPIGTTLLAQPHSKMATVINIGRIIFFIIKCMNWFRVKLAEKRRDPTHPYKAPRSAHEEYAKPRPRGRVLDRLFVTKNSRFLYVLPRTSNCQPRFNAQTRIESRRLSARLVKITQAS